MLSQGAEVVITQDLEAFSEKAAVFVARQITDRAEVDDRVAVVLSGGTTPRRFYRRLAAGGFQPEIPWRRVHLFWGDERCLPPQDQGSNYRMAYESLISRIPIPSENVHRMPGEKADPEKAAEEYEETLRDFFRSSSEEWPTFDLALLGIGPDGHIASLFPGSSVLKETKRWVAAARVEKLKTCRLTLTLPVFNHARRLIFLAAGEEKAGIMRDLLVADHGRPRFPAQWIRPHHHPPVFFLDQTAARFINPEKRPAP